MYTTLSLGYKESRAGVTIAMMLILSTANALYHIDKT